MGKRRWFRWLVVFVLAVTAGAIANELTTGWVAGAIGIAVGLVAGFVLEVWADRNAPDLVELYKQAKK